MYVSLPAKGRMPSRGDHLYIFLWKASLLRSFVLSAIIEKMDFETSDHWCKNRKIALCSTPTSFGYTYDTCVLRAIGPAARIVGQCHASCTDNVTRLSLSKVASTDDYSCSSDEMYHAEPQGKVRLLRVSMAGDLSRWVDALWQGLQEGLCWKICKER